MKAKRPLPAGTKIEYCELPAVVVFDDGGDRIEVNTDEGRQTWWWCLSGQECRVVELPASSPMKPTLTTEARPTPRTDAVRKHINEKGGLGWGAMNSLACDLERSNKVLTEALEEAQTMIAGLKQSANFHRDMGITLLDAKWLDPRCHEGCQSLVLKDEIQALRKVAQYYAGECVNYDGGSYARIILQGQSALQRPTP